MNNWDKNLIDTSRRFRTDKNFKNTILKNCSRLRQRSTDDHYTNRHNTLQPTINNLKKINNIRKRNSVNENTIEHKEIKNISKEKTSIDKNINIIEKNNKRNFHSNIRKAIFNYDTNKKIEKEQNLKQKNENDQNNVINKNKNNENENRNEKNINNENENKLNINENNNKNDNLTIIDKINHFESKNKRNKLTVNKNTITRSDTSEGIKELFIDLKDNNNCTKINYKRSNSIRRIMNSLYYHSYTTEKKEKSNSNLCIKKKNFDNNNSNSNSKKYIQPYNKNLNLVLSNNITNNENSKNLKTSLNNNNSNSNSSYIYQKKHKKIGNIFNLNNVCFNTYSTEDDSFITNDNKDFVKKNKDSQNPDLIKVKIVYQKPNKRNTLMNDCAINNNQTIQRYFKRSKILLEKKLTEDNITAQETSRNKRIKKEAFMTPLIHNNREQKLIQSFKALNNNDINNFENSINNNNDNFIIDFFDDIIELCNGIEEKTIFEILIKNLNKKYIIDYYKFFKDNNLNDMYENFNYCFKYFCIIIITFFFLSKDEILYKYNSVKIHLLFIQYIYSSLCYIGYQDLNSKNIKRFFQDYHFKKKVSIIQCTTSIIKLLFDEKEEYSSLNNVLKQLMVNARTTSVLDITRIINQTILFCFNSKIKGQNVIPYFKHRNSAINNIYNSYISNSYKEENNKNDDKMPVVPYIKSTMRKKFCLVLDLDETICHSLKLNFGYYFMLRPGAIELLTELSEFYEIIIFTSSPKIYADSIIDKIDEKGKLISHRLYKPHVIFERGKSVKKLNLIGRDLNKIIFVDNMRSNAKYNPKNLYLIPSWTDDIYDDELFKLKNKLKYIYTSGKFNDDITKAL